jgi:hypothetical protein
MEVVGGYVQNAIRTIQTIIASYGSKPSTVGSVDIGFFYRQFRAAMDILPIIRLTLDDIHRNAPARERQLLEELEEYFNRVFEELRGGRPSAARIYGTAKTILSILNDFQRIYLPKSKQLKNIEREVYGRGGKGGGGGGGGGGIYFR